MKKTAAPAWAEHPGLVKFYADHRKRAEDLYPSEKKFLPWLARRATTVLDIGCAAGGFVDIWQQYQPRVEYTGVDVSESLVAAARARYPSMRFEQGNCAEGLPFPDGAAEVVQALGWLHWEPEYRRAIAELWRLTGRYLFFDIRLVAAPGEAAAGHQRLDFAGPWDGRTTMPYLVVDWPSLARQVYGLQPASVLGYGYWGKPLSGVQGAPRHVCFATFVIEKSPPRDPMTACVDLPFPWDPALFPGAGVVPGAQLDERLGPHA